MADYSRYEPPTEAELHIKEMESNGYRGKYFSWAMGNKNRYPDYYYCLRGCGCLVWNTHEHTKNVCPEFSLVVGNGTSR